MNLKTKTILLIFLSLASNLLVAQINFAEISLRAALQRANISGQKVFVDSYAEWCQPCKEYDLIFTKRSLAKYFNKNFINVKVNMEEEFGDDFRRRYGIAFLPTIIFIDKDGTVIFKVDKLIDDIELMNLAVMAVEEQKPITTPPPPPFVEKEIISKPAEVKRVESDLLLPEETEVTLNTLEKTSETESTSEAVATKIGEQKKIEPEKAVPESETIEKEIVKAPNSKTANSNTPNSNTANSNSQNKIDNKVQQDENTTIKNKKEEIAGTLNGTKINAPRGPEMGPSSMKAEKNNIVTQENEKVLYVLDANLNNIPPEILYQEAYFRIQFNDGSHLISAKKYLNTQDVWSTEKNMKFIYDFLYNTDTPEFDFFVLNRESFEKMIGKDAIDRTMNILVSNKLHSGYPRPNFQESVKLFNLLDSERGEENAYLYYLDRLEQQDKKKEYLALAGDYIEDFNGSNQSIITNYVSFRLQEKVSKKELKELEQLMDSIEIKSGYAYNLSRARLLYNKGNKKEARESVQKAISEAKKKQLDFSEANKLLNEIKEL